MSLVFICFITKTKLIPLVSIEKKGGGGSLPPPPLNLTPHDCLHLRMTNSVVYPHSCPLPSARTTRVSLALWLRAELQSVKHQTHNSDKREMNINTYQYQVIKA